EWPSAAARGSPATAERHHGAAAAAARDTLSTRHQAHGTTMNVLLLSMPDAFEHMPPVAVRMPNGALASLAGNLDAHHGVSIADLILAQADVAQTVRRLVHELQPDVVGLSVMTFQRATAMKIARLIRSLKPDVRIVVGGYDPSLASAAYVDCGDVD